MKALQDIAYPNFRKARMEGEVFVFQCPLCVGEGRALLNKYGETPVCTYCFGAKEFRYNTDHPSWLNHPLFKIYKDVLEKMKWDSQ